MAKKESTFLNMVFTLFVVTFVSSTALGFVYEMTKGAKAKADLEKKINAVKEVVPEFNNDPIEEQFQVSVGDGHLTFYPAKMNRRLVGTAVETFTNKGFGGTVVLMVGFKPDGTINKVAVVDQRETPGLGDKMEKGKSNFEKQFEGKNPARFKLQVKKDGGDVDAITAATISSRAYCDALQRAYKSFMRQKRRSL